MISEEGPSVHQKEQNLVKPNREMDIAYVAHQMSKFMHPNRGPTK